MAFCIRQTVNMFVILLLLSTGGIYVASSPASNAELVNFEQQPYDPNLGTYKFSYEITDGTKREENGLVENPLDENSDLTVRGFYSYLDPDGNRHEFKYVADKDGFREDKNLVDQPLRPTLRPLPPIQYTTPPPPPIRYTTPPPPPRQYPTYTTPRPLATTRRLPTTPVGRNDINSALLASLSGGLG